MKTSKLISLLLLASASACAVAQSAVPAPAAPPAAVAPAAAAPAAPAAGEHQLNGVAAYYSNRFNGRKTASGKRFNNAALTVAHMTLPFGTKLKITNPKNKRTVVVTVTDRGPTTPGRVFDLTRAAAMKLGYVRSGITEVTAEIVASAPVKKSARMKK